MTTFASLTTLLLAAVILLPAGTAVAQEGVPASPTADAADAADAATASGEPGFNELASLLPTQLAGRPLAENLTLATGEQLLALMRPEESARLQEILDASGRTAADYTAATTWLATSASDVVVVQAHRIAGIDAADSVDAWVELLSMNLGDARVSEGSVAGRSVTLVSDGTAPEVPMLHLFPAGDVVWMVVAADEAIVAEAMAAVTGQEPVVEDEDPAAEPEPGSEPED